MEIKRMGRWAKISVTTLVVLLATLMISSTVGYNMSFSGTAEDIIYPQVNGEDAVPPAPQKDSSPEPRVEADGDFIISYEDGVPGTDAWDPSIAVSPSPGPWENSIHAVWTEFDETQGVEAIHYSMSKPQERGMEWSNDEESEGDRVISEPTGLPAFNPSITVEEGSGVIHVLYCQDYGDMTYEVHHISSPDNGMSWSSLPHLVSFRRNDGFDTPMWFAPVIGVSNDYQGQSVLHAAWSEHDLLINETGQQEIFYKRSIDGGVTWLNGFDEPFDLPVSDASTESDSMAGDPDIAVGGADSDVHVVWSQNSTQSNTSEVFYVRCTDAGAGNVWDPERIISNEPPLSDNIWPGPPKVAAFGNNVLSVWEQPSIEDGNYEVILSASSNAGAGTWADESPISFDDDHDVNWGSLDIAAAPSGAAYATWTEWHDTTSEVHYSMSFDPAVPTSWSGVERDIVLSHPDGQDATAPVMALSNFDGGYQPQIVWSEFNSTGAKGGRADSSTEIHYVTNTTYDVPVHLGWNLMSVPLIQNDTGILTVLNDSWGDGLTTWDMVQYFDKGGSGSWKSYATFKPTSINTLSDINHTMGFWINITAVGDGNLTVYGDYGTSTTIVLYAGWNLVGYPAQNSKSVTDSFSGVSEFVAAEGYSSSAPYKITQLAGSYMMQPGEGYWIKVSADTTWYIDW